MFAVKTSSGTHVPSNKWVINISDKPLTDAEEKLLSHRPNFTVVPKNPPIMEYIAAVVQACTKLGEGKADEFRVEIRLPSRRSINLNPISPKKKE